MPDKFILPTDREILHELQTFYTGQLTRSQRASIQQLHVHTERYAEDLITGGLGKTCKHLGAISAIALLDAYNEEKQMRRPTDGQAKA
jgi:hypothetical protein